MNKVLRNSNILFKTINKIYQISNIMIIICHEINAISIFPAKITAA